MKCVVLEREHFFNAMRLLHNPQVAISQAGSLWVTLWLSPTQIDVLAQNGIQCRAA
jgi:hypothetical protein